MIMKENNIDRISALLFKAMTILFFVGFAFRIVQSFGGYFLK